MYFLTTFSGLPQSNILIPYNILNMKCHNRHKCRGKLEWIPKSLNFTVSCTVITHGH